MSELIGLDISSESVATGDMSLHYSRELELGPLIDAELAATPSVEPVLNPGDVMIFGEMTMHRSGSTPWDEADVRDSANTWFFSPSRFPNIGAPYATE
jgi:hypothetical protein